MTSVRGLAMTIALCATGAAQLRSCLAFDSARQQVIFMSASTIAWTGTNWRSFSNSGIGGPPLVFFDPVLNRGFAIIGGNVSIWNGTEWGGWIAPAFAQWTNLFIWDTARNRLVSLASLGQTWEWDGTNSFGPFPPPSGPVDVLAFDPVSQRALAYSSNQQTWLWNGATWTLAAAGAGPQYLPMHMATDFSRNRLVCQSAHETWEWNGTSWLQVASNGPNGDSAYGLVYEPNAGMCLLFGYGDEFGVLGWSGTAWTQVAPPFYPKGTSWAAAYDAARDRFVMFAGDPADTWAWTGTDWMRMSPMVSPPVRTSHAMAYHTPSQRVVLFGGLDTANNVLGDTWVWDGTNWSAGANGPQPRSSPAITYEAARGTCLLFGGSGASNPAELGDTWEWNGASWTARQPAQSPPARSAPLLAHDPVRGQTVLTGGTTGTSRWTDTWEWDGINWRNRNPNPPAPPVTAMCYYPRINRVYASGSEWDGTAWTPSSLFGYGEFRDYDSLRQRLISLNRWGCTYIETPQPMYPVVGAGCGDARGLPGLTSLGFPALGDPSFQFEMNSSQPLTPVALGLAAASGSLPLGNGCDWQLAGPVLALFGVTDARSMAYWPTVVPIQPRLLGLTLEAQAVALDPNLPLGFGLTNHLHLTVTLGQW